MAAVLMKLALHDPVIYVSPMKAIFNLTKVNVYLARCYENPSTNFDVINQLDNIDGISMGLCKKDVTPLLMHRS